MRVIWFSVFVVLVAIYYFCSGDVFWVDNSTKENLSEVPPDRKPSTLPPNHRLYAIGDIHGRADLLRQLLEQISVDVLNSTAARNTVLFLGDYIDRGDESRQVLELVLGPITVPGITEFLPLTGNHERMMLSFLDKPKSRNHMWWLRNGGAQTVASFGLSPDLPPDRLAHELATLMGPLLARVRLLPLYHQLGDYLFVHAGVRPGLPLASQDEDSLLWIREPFLSWPGPYCGNLTVVHGHTPVYESAVSLNEPFRLSVDSGAWASGRLTAVVLEGSKRRRLDTSPPAA